MPFRQVDKSVILNFINQLQTMISFHDDQGLLVFSNQAYKDFFTDRPMNEEDKVRFHSFVKNLKNTHNSSFSYKNVNDSVKNEKSLERVNKEDNDIKKKKDDRVFLEVTYYSNADTDSNGSYFLTYHDNSSKNDQVLLQERIVENSRIVALGQMAGGIAHEINNPLSVITMNASLIQNMILKDDLDPKKLNKFISTILSTTTRIEKIISGLQFFSQEKPSEPFINEKLSVIVDDTLNFCLEKFKFKKISFSYQKINSLISLNCRPVQISQVLLNLLNNAADAAESSENKWISLVVNEIEKENKIEIKIIDSGPGIKKEHLKNIMEPFFSTKAVGKGTGLGLSISKGIIENHHGTLIFDTNAKNTTFVVTLPSMLPTFSN